MNHFIDWLIDLSLEKYIIAKTALPKFSAGFIQMCSIYKFFFWENKIRYWEYKCKQQNQILG